MRTKHRSARRARSQSSTPSTVTTINHVATITKALGEIVPMVVRGATAVWLALRQMTPL